MLVASDIRSAVIVATAGLGACVIVRGERWVTAVLGWGWVRE